MRAVSLFIVLAACSGAVSDPATKPQPQTLTISPASAVLYSGLPTTFVVSGGTSPFTATSSDQQAIPVAGPVNSTFTIIPGVVTGDSQVTLTVRDNANGVTQAALTVRPNLIASDVQVQPTDTTCAPAICSGGDALVTATAGAGRQVRFDVVSGALSVGDNLDSTITVTTDASGRARTRVHALAGAPTQTTLLQITDVASGAFQRVSIPITQATGPSAGFMAVPTTVTFLGPDANSCASGATATVYVFGGTPPYAIGTASIFEVSPTNIAVSGGSFTVRARGPCGGAFIPITDSAARTLTIAASNGSGTASPAVTVSPTDVTLGNCSSVANVSIVGGNGAFTVNSSDASAVYARQTSSNTVTVSRFPASTATASSAVTVQSGNSIATINVSVPVSAQACM